MDDFGADEIARFLTAVDGHLTAPARMVIIGGGAAALAFGIASTTEDLDTENTLSKPLVRALAAAQTETGLKIPVSPAGVAQFPYEFEARLERQLPKLKRLQVWTPERHDLALSKAVRGDEHDFAQLKEVHANAPLDFATLVERFRTEMTHVVGNPETLRLRFLNLVEELFGELKRVEADKALRTHKR